MTLLGLDCSTKSTGYALFEDNELIDYGTITANHNDPIHRIKSIVLELHKIIIQQQKKNIIINKIIIEEVRPEFGHNSTYRNLHTNKMLMYLQAAIIFMLNDVFPAIEIEYVYPSEWRKQVGIKTGKGIKRQELKNIDITTANCLFNINTNNDDIADACLIAYGFYKKKLNSYSMNKKRGF